MTQRVYIYTVFFSRGTLTMDVIKGLVFELKSGLIVNALTA